MKKEYVLKIMGYFFTAIGTIAIINSILDKNYSQMFWLSYASLILLGIGVSTKNSSFILVQVNIIAIPFLFWSVDFFHVLIAKQSLWGITDYFFEGGRILPKLVSLQHIITIPLSIYALYLIKIEKRSVWKYSFLQLAIIFLLSAIFTSPTENANCAFRSCTNLVKTTIYHPIIWFGATFFMAFITNKLIESLPFLNKKNNF